MSVSTKFIDTHCHYESKRFDKDRKEILEKISACCRRVVDVGTNTEENRRIEKLCKDYGFIYGMYGYFPTCVDKLDEKLCKDAEANMEELMRQINSSKCAGVGEIGLDYHWDSCGDLKGKEARDCQMKWFIRQAEIAMNKNLPVSIHSRDAEEDTVEALKKLSGLTGVIHCFAYSPDTAKFCTDMGLYLGIGGTSTYKGNGHIRQAIKEAPMEQLLLETDAPYLSPEPVRKMRNDSSNIQYVIENIAEIKGMSREEVIATTNENAARLFGI